MTDWEWEREQEGGVQHDPEVSRLGDGVNDGVTEQGTGDEEEVGVSKESREF